MFPIPLKEEVDIYRNGTIADVIADAKIYESYITKHLNEIEIDYWD